MGCHAGDEVAALKAAEFAAEKIRARRDKTDESLVDPGGHFNVVEIVEETVRVTCRHLDHLACSDDRYAGMETTLNLLLILGDKAILAHVGDSQLFLLRNPMLHQFSHDQRWPRNTLNNRPRKSMRQCTGVSQTC